MKQNENVVNKKSTKPEAKVTYSISKTSSVDLLDIVNMFIKKRLIEI